MLALVATAAVGAVGGTIYTVDYCPKRECGASEEELPSWRSAWRWR